MTEKLKLPRFKDLNLAEYPEALNTLLQCNLDRINQLLEENQNYSWDNLMLPLDDLDNLLTQFWSPLSHLHSVQNSPELRECYQACLPLLTTYQTTIGHHRKLYEAIKSIKEEPLNACQKKIKADYLRDFELSGVALPEDKKKRFEAISHRLSELDNQFENNLLDATNAFTLHISDEQRIKGIPEHALAAAEELAEEKKLAGWVFSLEYPSYQAIISYAEDRSLRETIYQAFVTRASDQGPHAGQFDNGPIMDEILALRQEMAELLGFKHYAELSLATKMAKSGAEVMDFLTDLAQKAHPQAQEEFKSLTAFAADNLGLKELQPWDVAFASEKLRQARYALSQEDLRPYFPAQKVISGFFGLIEKLFGIRMAIIEGLETWHPEVICYQVLDENQQIRGLIFADLYARPNKRDGAWMDELQSRRRFADGSLQIPIATLTCNFAKPTANKPAALSHDEVTTFFHEFGHCLHHVLTQVDYLPASGISGVEWDAVELPSQFFENWCWEEAALSLLTSHLETGETLPRELFEKLLAAKNFQSAMGMMRQLEFSIFDFRIHEEYQRGEAHYIQRILDEVRKQTTVVPIAPYNRFPNSFGHIFAGGYAAGYYSYKWAEVLSSDAFARFEEEGIFNPKTGHDFLHQILEVGGSKTAAEAFQAFRGRPASTEALLRHNGINL